MVNLRQSVSYLMSYCLENLCVVELLSIPTNVIAVIFWECVAIIGSLHQDSSNSCTPLHHLLKADVNFVWTKDFHSAFQTLMGVLTHPPVLINFQLSFCGTH